MDLTDFSPAAAVSCVTTGAKSRSLGACLSQHGSFRVLKEYKANPANGTFADLEVLQNQQLGVISVWDWEEVSRTVPVQWESLSAVLRPLPAMRQEAGGLRSQRGGVSVWVYWGVKAVA